VVLIFLVDDTVAVSVSKGGRGGLSVDYALEIGYIRAVYLVVLVRVPVHPQARRGAGILALDQMLAQGGPAVVRGPCISHKGNGRPYGRDDHYRHHGYCYYLLLFHQNTSCHDLTF